MSPKGKKPDAKAAAGRRASLDRKTGETNIRLDLNVDGSGVTKIETPIPFFSHMLDAFCRFANLDLALKASGDVHVDQHHTVEDVGLALGQALREALGERRGIRRAASASVPMDDALGFCAVDLSGRPYCVFDARFAKDRQGDLDLDLLPEFFKSLANASKANWHLRIQYGENEHHKIEALFKSAGAALGLAVARDAARGRSIPSTKGILE
jgi:imidazoleglycerol-phosphate dehydratase